MEGYDVDSSKFPSVKIPRLLYQEDSEFFKQVSTAPDIKLPDWDKVDVDLHTETNNFAPNEFREVVNLFGLVVYKGSNAREKVMVIATEKEIKAVKGGGVNNGGSMDRGPMMFTSDVSLPKDNK